jgi:hypothetical protein
MMLSMLAWLVLPAALASIAPRANPGQDQPSQRQPVVAPAAAPQADLRRLSVPQLLARIPADRMVREPWTSWPFTAEQLELRRRADAHELTDDDWRTALGTADAIHVRPLWPASVPLRVWIREPAWLTPAMITARAIRPDLGTIAADNLHVAWCGQALITDFAMQRQLALRTLPVDTTHVLFEVKINHLDQREADTVGRSRRSRCHARSKGTFGCLPTSSGLRRSPRARRWSARCVRASRCDGSSYPPTPSKACACRRETSSCEIPRCAASGSRS